MRAAGLTPEEVGPGSSSIPLTFFPTLPNYKMRSGLRWTTNGGDRAATKGCCYLCPILTVNVALVIFGKKIKQLTTATHIKI